MGKTRTPRSSGRFHKAAKRNNGNVERRIAQEIRPVTVRAATPEELARFGRCLTPDADRR